MAQIFGEIKVILEILSFLKFFWNEGKGLLNEIDEAKARKKKHKLNKALDELEKAKTKEDKREAIRRIANNSFR